jgi:hypothetical protein
MAKHARKIRAGLKTRQEDFSNMKGPDVKTGQNFHEPGSQNVHKTGYDPAPRG